MVAFSRTLSLDFGWIDKWSPLNAERQAELHREDTIEGDLSPEVLAANWRDHNDVNAANQFRDDEN
jgi:hypothetical protein